ncbi:uncharacterized protein LOC120332567 [Styela clava]
MRHSHDLEDVFDYTSVVNKSKSYLLKSATLLSSDTELSRELSHCLLDSTTGLSNSVFHNCCRKCGVVQTATNRTFRLKPKQKCGKNIQKALKSQKRYMSQSKRTKKTLRKFVQSRAKFIMKCKNCGFYDKITSCNRSEICAIKKERQKNSRCNAKKNTDSPASLKNTPTSKRSSIESFINTSFNEERKSSPFMNPRNKKKRLSQLSQLLANEASQSPSSSLSDFLQSL